MNHTQNLRLIAAILLLIIYGCKEEEIYPIENQVTEIPMNLIAEEDEEIELSCDEGGVGYFDNLHFSFVETQAEPYGGLRAFFQNIHENLQYPPEFSRMGIEGRVYVQFVVDEVGVLSDFQVVRGLHELLDQEVLRVMKLSPNWQSGNYRGVPVCQRIILPITFKL